MKAIYFGQDLITKYPNQVGLICREDGYWVGLPDILEALDKEEEVSIRLATAAEMKWVEAMATFHEAGAMMGRAIGDIYGDQGVDVVDDAVLNLFQAIMSVELPPLALTDEG